MLLGIVFRVFDHLLGQVSQRPAYFSPGSAAELRHDVTAIDGEVEAVQRQCTRTPDATDGGAAGH